MTPRSMFASSEERCFSIYNEVVVDFDLFNEETDFYSQSVAQSLLRHKETVSTEFVNNKDILVVR